MTVKEMKKTAEKKLKDETERLLCCVYLENSISDYEYYISVDDYLRYCDLIRNATYKQCLALRGRKE